MAVLTRYGVKRACCAVTIPHPDRQGVWCCPLLQLEETLSLKPAAGLSNLSSQCRPCISQTEAIVKLATASILADWQQKATERGLHEFECTNGERGQTARFAPTRMIRKIRREQAAVYLTNSGRSLWQLGAHDPKAGF
jgi:hypothetical protein